MQISATLILATPTFQVVPSLMRTSLVPTSRERQTRQAPVLHQGAHTAVHPRNLASLSIQLSLVPILRDLLLIYKALSMIAIPTLLRDLTLMSMDFSILALPNL